MYKSTPSKSPYKKRKSKQVKTKKDIICSQIKPDIASNEPFEKYQPAEGLFQKESDIDGKEVFQLTNTPKANRKSFIEKFEKTLNLSKDATPSPNKKARSQSLSVRSKSRRGLFQTESDIDGKEVFQLTNTPKANRKSFIEKFEKNLNLSKDATLSPDKKARNQSPSVRPKSRQAKKSFAQKLEDVSNTPENTEEKQVRSLRLKMKQELAGLKTETVDSDPEDNDTSDDETNDSDSLDEEMLSTVACDLTNKKKHKSTSFSEAYFTAQKQKFTGTSNKTLSNVKLEQTSVQELADILKNIPDNHSVQRETLFKKHCTQFEYWDSLLEAGFNILLYGVGSKLNLLKQFCKEYLEDQLYVVIHGFFPSLTLKQILCTITEDALDHDGKFSNVQDHCDYIKNYFSERDEDLFVVINSIDGMPLRSVKTQSILSSLATIPNIHFMCSIDHINAPLLWDQIMMSNFKWLWFDSTTFESYILETSYESSLLRDQSSHLLLSSLLHVYNSLTPNSRGVFLILAKHQKDEQKKSTNTGITFQEWYQECREAFLVNSELTMQAQMSEFKNHKLLTSRKSNDGIEVWYIPIDNDTLDQFLESCE